MFDQLLISLCIEVGHENLVKTSFFSTFSTTDRSFLYINQWIVMLIRGMVIILFFSKAQESKLSLDYSISCKVSPAIFSNFSLLGATNF